MQPEDASLDQALSRADDLLVASLQREERRRRWWIVLAVVLVFAVLATGVSMLVRGAAAVGPQGLNAGEAAEIGGTLERFRSVLVSYRLNCDSVFPQRPPAGFDAARLADYPSVTAWPDVLGHVTPDVRAFQLIAGHEGQAAPVPNQGAVAVEGALRRVITFSGYTTVLCLDGVAAEGAVVNRSYASVVSQGDVAGRLVFGSYATVLIDGDLAGGITADSYFAAVITGSTTGRLVLGSYAMVYLVGGFDGQAELSGRWPGAPESGPGMGSTLVIGGRATEEQLRRITGVGRVFVDDSDLPAGRHVFGKIVVTVGQRIPLHASSSQPS